MSQILLELDSAFGVLKDNLQGLTLPEALFVPAGGYRSILGTIKHAAGWNHVYRSYAFDAAPVSWRNLEWPHSLRDTVLKTETYLADLVRWLDLAHQRWREDLLRVPEAALSEPRPTHWGEMLPLVEIVHIIAYHHVYHAGEINQLLSIFRQEGWEEGEEVEENYAPSEGHRVIPPWRQ